MPSPRDRHDTRAYVDRMDATMTASLHGLLQRQLKRHFSQGQPDSPAWRDFLEAVNAAYAEFDTDRGMLERSLDLSSQELLQANSEMRGIFLALPDAFLRLTADGSLLSYKASPAMEAALTLREMLARRLAEAVPAAADQ